MNLSIRIFDPIEQEYLSRILELSGRRLKMLCQTTDVASADVVFVKQDDPGASVLINSSQSRSTPIVVVYGGEKDAFHWTLEKPATSKGAMNLLTSLQCRLGDSGACQAQADRGTLREHAVPVARGGCLIDRLHELAVHKRACVATLDEHKAIVLDAPNNRAYIAHELFQDKARLLDAAFRIERGSLLEIDVADAAEFGKGMPYISMEYLAWVVSQGATLLAPPSQETLDTRFRLLRWPSFTDLHHKSFHIAMTGRLMKKSLSIDELASACGTSALEIIKFYNFAYACDMLELPQASAMPANVVPLHERIGADRSAEKVGLFSKIIKRLAG